MSSVDDTLELNLVLVVLSLFKLTVDLLQLTFPNNGLMKGVILVPCNKTLTADQCTQLLLDNVYKQFRLMDKIISN